MSTPSTDDLRIKAINPLISPAVLNYYLPITETAAHLVSSAREQATRILHGKDDRLLVVIGPCSIHHPEAAIEYGKKLKPLIDKYADDLQIMMRVYFEKPRTTVGWKGLINDPHLDGSFDINRGLRVARGLLLELAEMGMSQPAPSSSTPFLRNTSPTSSLGAPLEHAPPKARFTANSLPDFPCPLASKTAPAVRSNSPSTPSELPQARTIFFRSPSKASPPSSPPPATTPATSFFRGGSKGPNYDEN